MEFNPFSLSGKTILLKNTKTKTGTKNRGKIKRIFKPETWVKTRRTLFHTWKGKRFSVFLSEKNNRSGRRTEESRLPCYKIRRSRKIRKLQKQTKLVPDSSQRKRKNWILSCRKRLLQTEWNRYTCSVSGSQPYYTGRLQGFKCKWYSEYFRR